MDERTAQLIAAALEAGFSHAGPLDPATLEPMKEVREMCAADKCRRYGKCWACPPGCGPLEALAEQMKGYSRGILVQTVVQLEDSFDFEGMMEGEAAHTRAFEAFAETCRAVEPDCMPLGAGTCMRCETCTYPDAPCRFPDKVFPSMEASGLLVTEVCKRNGMAYHHGANTVTYTSCCLF